VTPSIGSGAYAVQETIPAGWTVSAHDSQSSVNTQMGKILWGPFCDTTPRVFSYTLIPAGTVVTTQTLSGILSVNGQGLAITGARTVSGS
jgi:hypothetical protein